MKFVASSLSCCVLLAGCYRTSQPTDEPELVRIAQDRAFIKPPPYNSPTRPHWLTGKDQIPRFPEADFYAIPKDQLFFGLKVSEILNRPDLKDGNQFSKDSVYVKVAGLGKERTDDVGKDELERYRLSGKTAHSRHGWTCYYINADEDEDCFVSLGEESLKINLTRPGKFPYQKYHVYFFSNVHGRVYVYWNTSERNLPYWSEIQQAIMQKLVAWRYTKT